MAFSFVQHTKAGNLKNALVALFHVITVNGALKGQKKDSIKNHK